MIQTTTNQYQFSEEVYCNQKGGQKITIHVDNQNTIHMKCYNSEVITGRLALYPLYSKSSAGIKQAVLLKIFSCANEEAALALIRQSLMCSWELGYHVAFASGEDKIYYLSGFQKIPGKNFVINQVQTPSLFYELSWNGLVLISNYLILPLINKN